MAEEHIVVKGQKALDSYFTKRYLKFELVGGLDSNGKHISLNAKKETFLSLQGFRASVTINITGGDALPEMTAEIHNLPPELTNILSTLGIYNLVPGVLCNQIIVYASTDNSDPEKPFYVKVFEGSIINAYADYGSAPESIFYVQAQQLGGLNLRGLPPIAFEGKVSKEDVVRAIVDNFKQSLNAKNINLTKDVKDTFQDHNTLARTPLKGVKNCNVKGFFKNPHYYGDLTTQLYKAAADGEFSISAHNGILYMYPKGGSLTLEAQKKEDLPLFSARFGMIGYPQYCNQGLILRSMFRPDLLFGQAVQVDSTVKPACGIWPSMISMRHSLSFMIPNGPWETQLVVAKRQSLGNTTNDNHSS